MADEPDLPIPGVQASEQDSQPDPALSAANPPASPLQSRALGSNPIYKGDKTQ